MYKCVYIFGETRNNPRNLVYKYNPIDESEIKRNLDVNDDT